MWQEVCSRAAESENNNIQRVGDEAGYHAIGLRKVSVLIGMYGSFVANQKYLCFSKHISTSKTFQQ